MHQLPTADWHLSRSMCLDEVARVDGAAAPRRRAHLGKSVLRVLLPVAPKAQLHKRIGANHRDRLGMQPQAVDPSSARSSSQPRCCDGSGGGWAGRWAEACTTKTVSKPELRLKIFQAINALSRQALRCLCAVLIYEFAQLMGASYKCCSVCFPPGQFFRVGRPASSFGLVARPLR